MDAAPAHEAAAQAPRHIPIQTPYCLLCRFPVQPGEPVRAVLSIDDLDSFAGYTTPFTSPKHQPANRQVGAGAQLTPDDTDAVQVSQIHGQHHSTSSAWLLCRSPLCKTCDAAETFLYHADCRTAIAAGTGYSLTFADLWTIGAWTRPVPGVPYQADIRSLLASAVSSLGKTSVPFLQNVAEICSLPWELREMIAWHSVESPLWRVLSALHRFAKVRTLLEPGSEETVHDLANMWEWKRDGCADAGSDMLHNGDKDAVRVYLDDYGVQRIEQFSTQFTSYTQARVYTASWYIVESLRALDGVQVKTKGNFIRLLQSGSSSLHIWDTPEPPPPPLRWYDTAYIPRVIRCVDLQGAASLAVYCYNGRAFCIKPHQKAGPAEDPPDFMLHTIPSQDIVRLSVPLSHTGDADSFWVQNHRPWQDDSLLLVTSSGRLHVLGSCRHRILSGITPLAGKPRYILLPSSDDGTIARNFGVSAACQVPGWRNTVYTALQCSPHTMRRLMAAPTYMSTAPADGVVRVHVYRRPCAALCGMSLCVGLALEYGESEDGDGEDRDKGQAKVLKGGRRREERLGLCEEQDRREDAVIDDPVALHYQFVGTAAAPGMLVQCSRAGAALGDVRLCGTGWITRPMRGSIRLFFTKDGIVSME